jgi:hypothetical protein
MLSKVNPGYCLHFNTLYKIECPTDPAKFSPEKKEAEKTQEISGLKGLMDRA